MNAPEPSPPTVLTEDERALLFGFRTPADLERIICRILADRVAAAVQAEWEHR